MLELKGYPTWYQVPRYKHWATATREMHVEFAYQCRDEAARIEIIDSFRLWEWQLFWQWESDDRLTDYWLEQVLQEERRFFASCLDAPWKTVAEALKSLRSHGLDIEADLDHLARRFKRTTYANLSSEDQAMTWTQFIQQCTKEAAKLCSKSRRAAGGLFGAGTTARLEKLGTVMTVLGVGMAAYNVFKAEHKMHQLGLELTAGTASWVAGYSLAKLLAGSGAATIATIMGGALLGGYIASEFYVHNIKTYDSSIAEMLDNHCAGGIARNMIHKYTFNVDKAHDFLKEIYDGESYMFGGKAKNVAMAYIELVDKQHPAIARAIGKNKEFYDFLEKMLCWGCNATDHLVTLRNMSLHAVLTPDVYVD